MKNILVLTDFSAVAFNAAGYAIKLAEALDANVMVLHTYSAAESVPAGAWGEMPDEDEDHPEEKLHQFITRLQPVKNASDDHAPVIGYLSREGAFCDEVCHVIKSGDVDLVVMGACPFDNFPEFSFGNHVYDVLENAGCPVLLIPEDATFKSIENIFYAADLRYCDLKSIRLLTGLAKPFKANISLLHVCAKGLPELSEENGYAIFVDTISPVIAYPPVSYHSVKNDSAKVVINSIIEKQQLDVLAMAHRKNHVFTKLFSIKTQDNQAAYLHIPLLVMPIE